MNEHHPAPLGLHMSAQCAPGRRVLAAAVAMALAISAQAQSGGQAGPPQEEARLLDAVQVTAEFRERSLQEVPSAITAFDEARILDAGIETTSDFAALIPNMSYDESFTIGNSFVSVRGVQQINNADAPMAIVVDGVPQGNQKQFKMDLFEVERIEVLRGPQGALYGRNAIGGAINIITKRPADHAEGVLVAGVGNHGLGKLQASASGPLLQDRLSYRLTASAHTFDGAITSDYLGRKVDFADSRDFRLRLDAALGQSSSLDFRASKSRDEGGAVYDVSFDPAGDNNTNLARNPLSSILGESRRDVEDASLKFEHRGGGGGTLTAITGWTGLEETYYGDLDFCNPVVCPGGIFGFGQADQAQMLDVRLLSQELRWTSPDDVALRWIAGAYYLDTQRSLRTVARLLDLGPLTLVDSAEDNDNRAWAVFGQGAFDVGERGELALSLRYDRDERNQRDMASGTRRAASFDAWQPKVTYSHALERGRMWYATYGTGFRSGGFNGIGGRPFEDEYLRNYELGYKATLLDGRMFFNAAAFHQRSRDYQFFYVDLNAGGAQVIDNIDRAELQGLEFETTWRPSPGFELSAGLGLLDSRIVSFDPGLTVPMARDNRTPRTQRYGFNLAPQWNFALGTLRSSVRIDLERRGPRYWQADNHEVMDPVNLLGLRWTVFGGPWAFTLWGRNLLDERYYADFVNNEFSGAGRDVAFPAPRRAFGVDVRWSF